MDEEQPEPEKTPQQLSLSEGAAVMAAKGASKGGKARAAKLSPKRRREIAQEGGLTKWSKRVESELSKEELAAMPRATHIGRLPIGDAVIDCAVLEDGRRVLSQRSVGRALGRKRGGSDWRIGKDEAGGGKLPYFLIAENVKPFITNDLLVAASQPILYRPLHGGQLAHGMEATLLPQVCDVWLKAREAGVLTRATQQMIATKAEILMRGLARVGIIALVDEVTGYQYDRDRTELHRILSAYIAEELMPWTQRFPDSFYEELFRLKGWQYSPPSTKRPKMVGKLTARLIFEKLPPGVLGKLREKNPVIKPGYRRYKLHQFLTLDIGDKHLEKQVISVTTLMRVSRTWRDFEVLFGRAFPSDQRSIIDLLPLPDDEPGDDD